MEGLEVARRDGLVSIPTAPEGLVVLELEVLTLLCNELLNLAGNGC